MADVRIQESDASESSDGRGSATKNQFDSFRYLIVEKSDLYRAVMSVFAEAKSEFRLHLRPADIAARMLEKGRTVLEGEIEAALDNLVMWGNLQAYHDTAEVSTLADFHRRRFLYQLTATGEAAERAASEFLQAIQRPVTLEAAALSRIRDSLSELALLAQEPNPDIGKVFTTLRTIADDAEQMTAHAQSFFRWLHEQSQTRGADLDLFLKYKERLIDYLRRFLAELANQAGLIAARIEQLEPNIERLLELVIAHESASAFAKDEADRQGVLERTRRRWHQRWRGLRHWFVGLEGDPQVKQLRLAASAAIPRLLALAAQLHDRRATRSDRRADLVELAVWFLQATSDPQAHRLWRIAFGMAPARHWLVDPTTLEARDQRPVAPNTSWLEAPPVYIAPQLRQTGRAPAPAPARRIIDRSQYGQELRRRQEQESERHTLARRSLIEMGPRRLAEIGHLDVEALFLLVDLLDQAAGVPSTLLRTSATSEDGSLRIQIDRNIPQAVATIETPAGCLHTTDAWIHIEELAS